MDIQDAQREVRSVYVGGFWGQLVASVIWMLLLVPVGLYRLNWFFPALIVLVGAHYLPFASLYGTRMFLFLSAILVAVGVLFALCFSGTLALAPGSLDWPYSPSPGLGAAS